MGLRKRLISGFLSLAAAVTMMCGSFAVEAGAASKKTDIRTLIQAAGSYANWDGVTNVAQFIGSNGSLCFAVDGSDNVTIYKTDKGMSISDTLVLKKQHPIFGTAVCDNNGNYYLVTGENNSTSDTKTETVFISKYNGNGEHIKTTGDNGSSSLDYYYGTSYYTKEPFHAGNCDAAIYGNVLAVNYARRMYSAHQSNSVFAVNINDMSKVSPGVFYESHSFAQRTVAGKNGFVFASEGDCYDRTFTIYTLNMTDDRYSSSGSSGIFDFWVKQGALDEYNMYVVNENFAHMGGLAALSDGRIAFTSASARSLSASAANEREDIFIQIFDPQGDLSTEAAYTTSGIRSGIAGNNGNKEVTNYGVKWLTSLKKNESAKNVQIASTSDDEIVILYEYYDGSTYKGVYYIVLDPNGNILIDSTLFSKTAKLNPCEMPVYADASVCWAGNKYGDSTNKIYLYSLDPFAPQDAGVTGIKVTAPAKIRYCVGDDIDLSDGKVTVSYDNNTSETIDLTLDMISGYDKTKSGTQTITVTYEDMEATFTVTVMDTPIATLDDMPIDSISGALKSLQSGEHTIFITSSVTEKTITIPKGLTKVTITCNGGVTLTTNTITANSPLVLNDVTLAGVNPAKPTVIKANSDFSADSGTFGNITVKGKAALSDITVNGNLALSAKADKDGNVTDTLERITVTKKVSSNNNVEFVDCPSLGTVNVKGLVKISGEETTKAVAVTSGAKTGTCTIDNLEVEKKLSVSADLSAYNLTANNAVSVKGNAVIEQSDIAGKLAVAKNLTAEGIGVKSAVDVKGNAVIDFSSIIGKLNVKGILTVNSDVRVENSVTCAELNSTEGAELTALSLSVTKNGVSADSAEITLTLIDKFGGEFIPQPDKKGVITVSKKFKDSKTKEKEFDVPALKFNNSGTICPLKCVSGKLVVSA